MTPWTLFLYFCAVAGGLSVMAAVAGILFLVFAWLRQALLEAATLPQEDNVHRVHPRKRSFVEWFGNFWPSLTLTALAAIAIYLVVHGVS